MIVINILKRSKNSMDIFVVHKRENFSTKMIAHKSNYVLNRHKNTPLSQLIATKFMSSEKCLAIVKHKVTGVETPIVSSFNELGGLDGLIMVTMPESELVR